ncbi:hypothetical protein Landi51_06096 [Colletotrichum acutatum]
MQYLRPLAMFNSMDLAIGAKQSGHFSILQVPAAPLPNILLTAHDSVGCISTNAGSTSRLERALPDQPLARPLCCHFSCAKYVLRNKKPPSPSAAHPGMGRCRSACMLGLLISARFQSTTDASIGLNHWHGPPCPDCPGTEASLDRRLLRGFPTAIRTLLRTQTGTALPLLVEMRQRQTPPSECCDDFLFSTVRRLSTESSRSLSCILLSTPAPFDPADSRSPNPASPLECDMSLSTGTGSYTTATDDGGSGTDLNSFLVPSSGPPPFKHGR